MWQLADNRRFAANCKPMFRRCAKRRVRRYLLYLSHLEEAMENTARKTHPMIIVAATAVTVASFAAIASFTGLLPAKSAPPTTLTATAPLPPPDAAPIAALPAPAPKAEYLAPLPPAKPHKTQQVERGHPPPSGDLRYANEQTTTTYPRNNAGVDAIPARPDDAPPAICHDCGIIEAVREMTRPAEGSGVGAVRYCEFSTGPFVEPITAWEPPHRLAFDVAEQPHPMRELSPWGAITPPHLEETLHCRRGEFRLVALPDGRTRLEGRTWYAMDLWPQAYFKLWADDLIHRIHVRVLDHIESLAEAPR